MEKQNLRFLWIRGKNASVEELLFRTRRGLADAWIRAARRMGREPWSPPKDLGRAWRGLRLPDFSEEGPCGAGREPIEPQGDIRLLWEPARLQGASAVLLSSAEPGQSRRAARDILDWLRDHPFPEGPHYRSAMECALRIPVFLYALRLSPDLEEDEARALAGSLYRHAALVESRLSLYSSRGNHTAAEAVGLLFAGAVFAEERRGRRWLEKAFSLLGEEADHLVLPDGGPGEQAFGYHRFVLDLFGMARSFIRKNHLGSIPSMEKAIERGEAFLSAFEGPQGALPSIGDWDDGRAAAPGIRPGRPDGVPDMEPSLESGIWKCGIFTRSGYSVLKRRDGARLIFDHGFLGLPPLYNHGHADALSVCLDLEGFPMLTDPGTYRYNGVPSWRAYFRGTRAHNTVCVDGKDQAVQEAPFLWSRPFEAGLTKADAGSEGIVLEGLHEGYRRLAEPVTHKRRIHALPTGAVEIADWFEGGGRHAYEQNFHLHPETDLSAAPGGWTLAAKGGASLRLTPLDGVGFDAVRGGDDPKRGWYSRRYGELEPAIQLTRAVEGLPQEARFSVRLEF